MEQGTDLATPGAQAALRRAILAGDTRALRAFHDACLRPLYTFAYHRLGRDHHAAEEVVQETLVLALERMADFDPERGDLHTWIALLARNGIRRSNDQRRRYVPLEQGGDPATESSEAALDTAALVGVALERLPSHYRTVLERKYVEGQSVRTIASASATSEKAVESLLGRARDAFKVVFHKLSGTSTTTELRT